MRSFTLFLGCLILLCHYALSKDASDYQYGLHGSIAGNNAINIHRMGLRMGGHIITDHFSLNSNVMLNFSDPLHIRNTSIGTKWYQYTPMISDWSSSHLDNPPPFIQKFESGEFVREFHPGFKVSLDYFPMKEGLGPINLFLFFETGVQANFGKKSINLNYKFYRENPDYNYPVVADFAEFDGVYTIFPNTLGLGLQYQPFNRWAFRLSSGTGIVISRIYTDHEREEEIEKALNRMFSYSQFDFGVRYFFRN